MLVAHSAPEDFSEAEGLAALRRSLLHTILDHVDNDSSENISGPIDCYHKLCMSTLALTEVACIVGSEEYE